MGFIQADDTVRRERTYLHIGDDKIQNSRNACTEEVEKGNRMRRNPRGLCSDREAC